MCTFHCDAMFRRALLIICRWIFKRRRQLHGTNTFYHRAGNYWLWSHSIKVLSVYSKTTKQLKSEFGSFVFLLWEYQLGFTAQVSFPMQSNIADITYIKKWFLMLKRVPWHIVCRCCWRKFSGHCKISSRQNASRAGVWKRLCSQRSDKDFTITAYEAHNLSASSVIDGPHANSAHRDVFLTLYSNTSVFVVLWTASRRSSL